MAKIALIEDDISLGESLSKYLQSEGFQIAWCKSIQESGELDWAQFDMVLLDWRLPDGDGIDLLPQVRHLPVIFLTARDTVVDKVLALESGAKDYMAKPFDPRELLARIRVQLRAPEKSDEVQVGDIKIEINSRQVYFKGQSVSLTKMEFDLLLLLARHPQRVFSRDELLNKVWGFDQFPSTRTVDTHVLQLRHKMTAEIIRTVHKIGYQLQP